MSNLICKLLNFSDVSDAVGLGRSSIYKRMSSGAFPKPVALGTHCIRWRSDDIAAWIGQHTVRADDDLATIIRARKASAARKEKAKQAAITAEQAA